MARIREVWAPNLEAEMRIIRELVDTHPYIAMVGQNPSHSLVAHSLFNPGYRISRRRSATHWNFQDLVGLSLSDYAL